MENSIISKVEIIAIPPQKGLIGFATIIISIPNIGQLKLASIGIHCSKTGEFKISFPARKYKNQLLFYWKPLNSELEEVIRQVIVKEIKESSLFGFKYEEKKSSKPD